MLVDIARAVLTQPSFCPPILTDVDVVGFGLLILGYE